MNKRVILFISVSVLFGCGGVDKAPNAIPHYFDLKTFFEKEAVRLSKNSPFIQKTVSVNGSTETKKVKIADWNTELSSFTNADINKSAWIGLFKIKKTGDSELYTSDEDKVAVKELYVTKKQGKVSVIRILLNTTNYLYQSTDTLSYYPDSAYQIKKTQHIKLLNTKEYKITGTFVKK